MGEKTAAKHFLVVLTKRGRSGYQWMILSNRPPRMALHISPAILRQVHLSGPSELRRKILERVTAVTVLLRQRPEVVHQLHGWWSWRHAYILYISWHILTRIQQKAVQSPNHPKSPNLSPEFGANLASTFQGLTEAPNSGSSKGPPKLATLGRQIGLKSVWLSTTCSTYSQEIQTTRSSKVFLPMSAISSIWAYSMSSRRFQRLKTMQLCAVSLITQKPTFAERLAGPWHCTGCISVEAGSPLRKPTATTSNPWAPCASENVVKPRPSLPQPRSCEKFAMEPSTKFLESWSLWSACSPSQSQQPGEPESGNWEWEWRIFDTEKQVWICSFRDIIAVEAALHQKKIMHTCRTTAILTVTWRMMIALHPVPSMLRPTKIR